MKRKYLLGSIAAVSLFLFVLFNNFTVLSSYTSSGLEPEELTSLKSLIASDTSAKARFSIIERTAFKSLTAHPDPIERIYSEGLLASDPRKIRTGAAILDFGKIEALSWASIVSSDNRYERKAKEFILAWARVNTSDGNAINETKFEPLIRSYSLIKKSFSASEAALINNWLRNKARLLMNNSSVDNWESHRLLIAGLTAAAINDTELWQNVKRRFKVHLNSSFNSSGVSRDFYHRDALHYHLYSIEPLLTLACLAQRKGDNFFTTEANNGASLHKAVEFVVPYAKGMKSHMEFQNTKSSFDRRRAAAGEDGYIPHLWEPKKSLKMFSAAGCFESYYDDIAVDLSENERERFVTWRLVLNAVDPYRTDNKKDLNPTPPVVPVTFVDTKPLVTTVAVDKAVYVENFSCGANNNNSGCQGITSCKKNDELVEVKAVCNLEENWRNVSQNLQSVLSALSWGSLQVVKASESINDGLCYVNDSNVKSGKISIRKSASVRFGCQERDSNGGDCRIQGQIKCRSKN